MPRARSDTGRVLSKSAEHTLYGLVTGEHAPHDGAPSQVAAGGASRDEVADAVCAALGGGSTQVLRRTSGTTVAACGDRVVRVAAPSRSAIDLPRLTGLAVALRRCGVHVPEPLAWFYVDDWEVSTWRRYPDGAAPQFEKLGRRLAQLHAVDVQAFAPLPPFADTLTRGTLRIQRYAAEVPGLLDTWSTLVARLATACESREAVLHGDMNSGNILWGADDVVLCDLEAVCVGPPEWDLAKLVNSLTAAGHSPDAFSRVRAGYGRPLRDEVFDACRAVDTVKSITWQLSELGEEHGVPISL